jgi:hypothetical protein
MTNATHTFTAETDCNGEPNALKGLPVSVIHREAGTDEMGNNCVIRLHCTPQELADRHNACEAAAGREGRETADSIAELYAGHNQGIDCEEGWLVCCANESDLTGAANLA